MAAGGGAEMFAVHLTTGKLWLPAFNIGFGLSPTTLGILLFIFRAWDAISDPLMGHITDNTRSRWGRRRPWIVGGAVATGLCVALLFRPDPAWGQAGMIAYIFVLGMLLFTAATVWAMPFHSLLMELTPNYDERTRLSAVCALFSKGFGLINGWALAIATGAWFINAATGEPDFVRGIQTISLIMGVVIVILGALPGLFVRERFAHATTATPKEPFWKNFRETLTCRPLWLLNGIVFFNLLGLISTSGVGQYVNIYYVSEGKVANAFLIEGYKETAMFLVGILSIPLWVKVCERLDKKVTLAIVLFGTMLGHLLNFFCLNPEYPYLQIIPSVFWSGVSSAIWLIVPSMKMDVADYDELDTHRRREGSLNSLLSWCIKMGIALGVAMSGFLLDATGFDVALGTTQPPEVLRKLVLFYIFVPIALWIPTFYFLWRYPLNRTVMAEVRAKLEARRGSI
jgi:GPH family glycoside/pentoside/hexuronide:cation symporter